PAGKAPLAAAGGPAAVHPEEGGRTARSGEVLLAPLPGERKPASATLTKGRISLCLPERIQQKWIPVLRIAIERNADCVHLSAVCALISKIGALSGQLTGVHSA